MLNLNLHYNSFFLILFYNYTHVSKETDELEAVDKFFLSYDFIAQPKVEVEGNVLFQ